MRIRPLYWMLLFVCCVGVFTFAVIYQEHVPALVHVQIQRHDTSSTIIVLTLTDIQGLAIEGAHVHVQAVMKDMAMTPPAIHVSDQPRGFYLASLDLSMNGSWVVTVAMQASGFVIPHQSLCLQVEPVQLNTKVKYVSPHH